MQITLICGKPMLRQSLASTMMNFKGKLCLAPMVRSGELPMRLSALRNGADIVWTPELVDKKLIQTTRVINSKINTVDYVYINEKQKKNSLVFRTYPEEENSKIILQLGSSDPELAVAASLKVIDDVNGIDLNCGCPKNFSTHSGMGAALLSTPDLLCSILSNLVNRVGKPHGKSISCKIRLLDDYKSTISLIDKICETGITNLTIHCRRRDMRNRQDVIWHYLPDIIPRIQAKGISVIINGGLLSNVDFRNMRSLLSQDVGGMIAEAAESNPTIFNKDGPSLQHEVVSNFLSLCKIYNYDCFPNSKYMLLNQIPGKSPYYGKIAKCKTYDDIENVLNDSENFKSDKFLSKIYIKDLQQNKFFDSLVDFKKYLEDRKNKWTNFLESFDAKDIKEPEVLDPRKRSIEAVSSSPANKKPKSNSEPVVNSNTVLSTSIGSNNIVASSVISN